MIGRCRLKFDFQLFTICSHKPDILASPFARVMPSFQVQVQLMQVPFDGKTSAIRFRSS